MAYLILIDGLNPSGKEQVTEYLANQLKAEVFVCDNNTPAPIYVQMMQLALDGIKPVIIQNTWRNQYVLDQLGHKRIIPIALTRMLDRIALGCDARVAQCQASPKVYVERLKTKGVEVDTRMYELLWKMDMAWVNAFPMNGMHVIDTSDALVNYDYKYNLDLLIDSMHRAISKTFNQGPGIGRWKQGAVLIVGDRHGPSLQPYKVNSNIAFCDMAKAGTSYWLTSKLEDAGISEESIYWINSYDQNDQPTESAFIDRLKPQTILALGDNAARWCETYGLRFEQFGHPQWHKRFKYHEDYPLIARLKELTNELKNEQK